MTLSSGVRLGPYEIQAPLGAGGMGEVYRARDTRLGREVAIKILPEFFARDPERLHRFERETRAVATLNHPNILAIYDVGQHESVPFLVSELLEGESLRQPLERGPLPHRKTIEYGVQIAQGLAAAHDKGIVHRDLKPENLFVTKDGRMKILDFGLAKLAAQASGDYDEPTITEANTAAGVVLGTTSYMAPEQVQGEPPDPRTDIFAFGAVMYEMLAGRRAFRRDTPAETMTAILREDPAEVADPAHRISPALEKIVRRCLEKNPRQRFQSAMDLSFALSALSGTDTSVVVSTAASRRFSRTLLLGIVLAAVASAAWLLARRPNLRERLQFAIPVPGEVSHMALSGDGSMLVSVFPEEKSGLPVLYVTRIGSSTGTVLPDTEGASYPFWSPDGRYIAFFAKGKLVKIPSSGGTPQALASVSTPRGGSWGSRDVIIYSPDAGSAIWRINPDGTGAAPVTETLRRAEENTHRWPVFLPDGDHFLFWGGSFSDKYRETSGIYVSSLDGKDRKRLVLCHSSFAYDSGHLFYADEDRRLVSVGFNPTKATISGNPAALADLVGYQPATYWASLTASGNGTLVYNTSTGATLSVLTWMDRAGKELGHVGKPAVICNPTLSPDGSRVAVDVSDLAENNVDVWLESTSGAGNTRFTFSPEEDVVGVWSRDGSILAYRENLPGHSALITKRATGLEREQNKFEVSASDDIVPNSWSMDGRQILATHSGPSGGTHLLLVPLAGGNPTPFAMSKGNEMNGQLSPDGKWVAYASDESGTWQIYVTTFPGAVGKFQVSRGGGTEPRWNRNGIEIFYLSLSGVLTSVPVDTKDTFSTGAPQPLFQIRGRAAISATDHFSYDVAGDGKRFLVNQYVKPDHVDPLTIVLHADTRL
jgi:serine/threonine protein kinase/roadblock/LC7 domain-containing protein